MDGEKKKGMAAVWANFTPEERAKFVKERADRIKAAKAAKREEKLRQEEIQRQRQKIREEKIGGPREQAGVKRVKSELLRMTDKAYLPEWSALNAAIGLAREGLDLEEVRREFFPNVSQEIWNRFKKAMFAIQISSPEDVGNELLMARDSVIAEIRREVVKMRELQVERPTRFHAEILKALTTIQAIQSDTAKRLVDIGAVGHKKTGGVSVQIVNYIPRPEKMLTHEKTQNFLGAPKELESADAEIIDIPKLIEKVKA